MSDKLERNLDLPEFDPDKHHSEWYDMLGQLYQAGDIVAYAATVGRSSGLTVGMVRRINAKDSAGKTLRKRKYDYEVREYIDQGPDCTVTIVPLVDSENRWRWTGRDVTVGPAKVIRLDVPLSEVLNA